MSVLLAYKTFEAEVLDEEAKVYCPAHSPGLITHYFVRSGYRDPILVVDIMEVLWTGVGGPSLGLNVVLANQAPERAAALARIFPLGTVETVSGPSEENNKFGGSIGLDSLKISIRVFSLPGLRSYTEMVQPTNELISFRLRPEREQGVEDQKADIERLEGEDRHMGVNP